MKVTFISLCLMACLATGIASAESPFEDGLKPSQLAQIARILPPAPISTIRLFREAHNGRLSAAVLTGRKKYGWQILLISPEGSKDYRTSWTSPKLPDSFDVSSPTALTTYGLADEEGIVFSGCAPHMCPQIFSALLYVPTRHQVFVGTCDNGQTKYSFAPRDEFGVYKEALNDVLRKIDGIGHACSAEPQGRDKGRNVDQVQ